MHETKDELTADDVINESLALELGCTRNAYGILYPPMFEVNDFGIQKRAIVDKTHIQRITIGSRLDIAGLGTIEEGCEPSLVLKFRNIVDEEKMFILPLEELVAKNSDWAKDLVHAGYVMEPEFKKDFIKFFIETSKLKENRMLNCYIAKQIGWHGSSYVLRDIVYGDSAGVVPNVPQGASYYNMNGTYEEWKKLAALAEGNAFFEFALASAFAPALLKPLSITNGIVFHLWGGSSCGKSISQMLAQSVWGAPSQSKSWAGSLSGIEVVMSNANDNFVCLDEYGRAKSSEVQALVYMIANGEGKARATRKITLREQKKWRCIVLSSGEQTLEEKMKEINMDPKAGAMLRMPTIPVSNEMITNLHGFSSSKQFVEEIEKLSGMDYGYAGRDFLEHLTSDKCKALEGLGGKVNAYEAELLPEGSGSQLARATKYFALAMAASDLIREFGIVDFDCRKGVKTLYKSYLEHLATTGNAEESSIVKNVVSFINRHHCSRFVNYDMNSEARERQTVYNCVGYVKTEGESPCYYFYKDEFYSEVAKCSNRKLVKKVLLEKRLLVLDGKGKNPKKSFGSKKSKRYVCIRLDNMEDEEASDFTEPKDGINSFCLPASHRKRIDTTGFKY